MPDRVIAKNKGIGLIFMRFARSSLVNESAKTMIGFTQSQLIHSAVPTRRLPPTKQLKKRELAE
jgi:hypothetical protein